MRKEIMSAQQRDYSLFFGTDLEKQDWKFPEGQMGYRI